MYLDLIRKLPLFVLNQGTDIVYVYTIKDDGHLNENECLAREVRKDFDHMRGISRAAFMASGIDQATLYLTSGTQVSIKSHTVSFNSTRQKADCCPSLSFPTT